MPPETAPGKLQFGRKNGERLWPYYVAIGVIVAGIAAYNGLFKGLWALLF